MILFGFLDVVILIQQFERFMDLRDVSYFPVTAIGSRLAYVLLIFSSYFLIRQSKIGLWITYIQFPLRILFVTLSFNFLWTIYYYLHGAPIEKFEDQVKGLDYKVLVATVMGLEVLRLIVTIQIHRKYFRGKTTPTLS